MQAVALIRTGWREPVDVLRAFADEPWSLGLLSDGASERGRWSYLAREPQAVLSVGPADARDPFVALEALLGSRSQPAPDGPPFQGGVAGLCAYELGDHAEPLGLERMPGWPDLAVGLYPAVLAFDHHRQAVTAVGRGRDEPEAQANARRAASWLEMAARPERRTERLAATVEGDDPHAYERAVAEVVERIRAGEIFQANVARRWLGRLGLDASPFAVLERLAQRSPAPFAAWMRLDRHALVSNSPERFVRVEPQGEALVAETRPIKGTAPRGGDPASDRRLAEALRTSAKDKAENLMIVDLMRNDLSRACAPGTVAAPALFAVESFPNVHHLVSTVTGRLAPGRTAVDLLRAAFPPGSITGAPKVQAMKVIKSLEPPRGPFFGSMIWAGFDGAFDSSVLIRTAAFTAQGDGWSFEARAGAGLVADSQPEAERRETEIKIAALLAALTEPAITAPA